MRLLDLTLETPAENIGLDEALLNDAESSESPLEVLRLWESSKPFVVIGRSSKVATEVRLDQCERDNIEIVRRTSGGAAIVAGSGCLMYAVVLSYELRPQLRSLCEAHQFVLGRVADAVAKVVPGVQQLGTSDLTIGNSKFSGNSMRCSRDHFLYHGTLLYDFELSLITRYLGTPPRQPEYRGGRSHDHFVENIQATSREIRRALCQSWNAIEILEDWPEMQTRRLVDDRYSRDDWNLRR